MDKYRIDSTRLRRLGYLLRRIVVGAKPLAQLHRHRNRHRRANRFKMHVDLLGLVEQQRPSAMRHDRFMRTRTVEIDEIRPALLRIFRRLRQVIRVIPHDLRTKNPLTRIATQQRRILAPTLHDIRRYRHLTYRRIRPQLRHETPKRSVRNIRHRSHEILCFQKRLFHRSSLRQRFFLSNIPIFNLLYL